MNKVKNIKKSSVKKVVIAEQLKIKDFISVKTSEVYLSNINTHQLN